MKENYMGLFSDFLIIAVLVIAFYLVYKVQSSYHKK